MFGELLARLKSLYSYHLSEAISQENEKYYPEDKPKFEA
jgi:hypothetical protein